MDMSLISLSSVASQAAITNDIGVAVLDMAMEDIDTLGDGMRKMMELSVNPGLGANIDISV